MGFEKKRDAIMRLKPDILVLQECSAKDIENTDAPHLDFAFVSKALSRSCEFLIGNPSEWIHKSDHMPLILTISL